MKSNDKVTKLSLILKWQALVASSQDNDKMEAIFQCQEVFYKFGCSGKNCVEALTLVYLFEDIYFCYSFLAPFI